MSAVRPSTSSGAIWTDCPRRRSSNWWRAECRPARQARARIGDRGPKIQLFPVGPAPCGPGAEAEGPALTPVMARLGQEDLATLDTLITAGIASSRAEAVRWALARIRERPAYEQLRVHTREIENLKSQF